MWTGGFKSDANTCRRMKLVVECREFPKSAGPPGGSNDGNPILALPDDYSSFLDLLGTQQNSQPHQEGIP